MKPCGAFAQNYNLKIIKTTSLSSPTNWHLWVSYFSVEKTFAGSFNVILCSSSQNKGGFLNKRLECSEPSHLAPFSLIHWSLSWILVTLFRYNRRSRKKTLVGYNILGCCKFDPQWCHSQPWVHKSTIVHALSLSVWVGTVVLPLPHHPSAMLARVSVRCYKISS